MAWEYWGIAGEYKSWRDERKYCWVYYDQDGELTQYASVYIRFMPEDYNPGSNPPGDASISDDGTRPWFIR